jgi:hypothetical protein
MQRAKSRKDALRQNIKALNEKCDMHIHKLLFPLLLFSAHLERLAGDPCSSSLIGSSRSARTILLHCALNGSRWDIMFIPC